MVQNLQWQILSITNNQRKAFHSIRIKLVKSSSVMPGGSRHARATLSVMQLLRFSSASRQTSCTRSATTPWQHLSDSSVSLGRSVLIWSFNFSNGLGVPTPHIRRGMFREGSAAGISGNFCGLKGSYLDVLEMNRWKWSHERRTDGGFWVILPAVPRSSLHRKRNRHSIIRNENLPRRCQCFLRIRHHWRHFSVGTRAGQLAFGVLPALS